MSEDRNWNDHRCGPRNPAAAISCQPRVGLVCLTWTGAACSIVQYDFSPNGPTPKVRIALRLASSWKARPPSLSWKGGCWQGLITADFTSLKPKAPTWMNKLERQVNESQPSQPNDDMYDSGVARILGLAIQNEHLEMSRKIRFPSCKHVDEIMRIRACRGRQKGGNRG